METFSIKVINDKYRKEEAPEKGGEDSPNIWIKEGVDDKWGWNNVI
jgi:hypothetical protein